MCVCVCACVCVCVCVYNVSRGILLFCLFVSLLVCLFGFNGALKILYHRRGCINSFK